MTFLATSSTLTTLTTLTPRVSLNLHELSILQEIKVPPNLG